MKKKLTPQIYRLGNYSTYAFTLFVTIYIKLNLYMHLCKIMYKLILKRKKKEAHIRNIKGKNRTC